MTAFTQLISLDTMRNTVRRMSARYTSAQMPNSQIDNYINRAYTLHMPLDFKNQKLNKPYVFTTKPNVDTYDFIYEAGLVDDPTLPPGNKAIPGNIQIGPPVYCQGYMLNYFQDKSTFYMRWPKLSVNQQIDTGTGLSTTYTGTIPPFPFLRAQLDIFGNVTEAAVIISAFDDTGYNVVFNDIPVNNSNIGIIQDEEANSIGTVNYVTGAYSFTPTLSVIPATATIYASVVPYQPSRPTDILFTNQQIIFRPVPLQVFQVEFQISQQPTQLIANNQAPELDEWYLFICAWAAKLIFTDFPDEQAMAYLMPTWQEQVQYAQRRTLRQLGNQRAQTIFSTPMWSNRMNYFYGTAYSGN